MNSVQRWVIKCSLYLFFLYVLLVNGLEQFYFLNFGIFNAFLAFSGIFIVWKAPLRYSLLCRLLLFPIIGTNIFEHYIKPSVGLLFHVQDLFWLIYIVLIVLITQLKKVWILFIISIWGFFVSFNELPSKLVESVGYWNSFQKSKQVSPVVSLIKRMQKDKQTIYLICLDGYPNFEAEKKNYSSILPSYLSHKGFSQRENLSIGDTPQSIPFLLFNKIPKATLYGLPYLDYNAHIKKFMQEQYHEKSIEVQSVFGDYWLTESFFPLFPPPPVNFYIQKIYKNIFQQIEKPFDVTNINRYHQELVHSISNQSQIQFYHFITFHGMGYEGERDMQKDIHYADYWLQQSINKIEKINPKSHIIVFSDHGERFIPGFDRNKSILYYK